MTRAAASCHELQKVHLTTQSTACHSTTQSCLDKKQNQLPANICSHYRAVAMVWCTVLTTRLNTHKLSTTPKDNRSVAFSLSTYGMRMHVESPVSIIPDGLCLQSCTNGYLMHRGWFTSVEMPEGCHSLAPAPHTAPHPEAQPAQAY
jgi:hypothetical protein